MKLAVGFGSLLLVLVVIGGLAPQRMREPRDHLRLAGGTMPQSRLPRVSQ